MSGTVAVFAGPVGIAAGQLAIGFVYGVALRIAIYTFWRTLAELGAELRAGRDRRAGRRGRRN